MRDCERLTLKVLHRKFKLGLQKNKFRGDLVLIWDGYTNFGDTLFEPINSRKVEKEKLNFCINVKNWDL